MILTELTGSAPEESTRHELTARVDDDALLPELVRRVSGAGIAVHELSLYLPTPRRGLPDPHRVAPPTKTGTDTEVAA